MFWQSQVCTLLDGRPLCGCGCAYFNKNQWDTKDGICLNPFQWKAFHCILCRFMCARACIFIENRMWPNICLTSVVYFFFFRFYDRDLRQMNSDFIQFCPHFVYCCYICRHKGNEYVHLFSFQFLSFYHFHHSFSLLSTILGVKAEHSMWRSYDANDKLQNACLKLNAPANKSHYDKWISLKAHCERENSLLKPNEAYTISAWPHTRRFP